MTDAEESAMKAELEEIHFLKGVTILIYCWPDKDGWAETIYVERTEN